MQDQFPFRRRFQFRLRTLMIVVTLLAVACAYVAWQSKIVRERRAVADLEPGDRTNCLVPKVDSK
jgi:hypothetical protein